MEILGPDLEDIRFELVNVGWYIYEGLILISISNISGMGLKYSGEENGGCYFGRVRPQPFR